MIEDKDDLLDSALTPEPFESAFEMRNGDATDASSFDVFVENSPFDTSGSDSNSLPDMDSLLNEEESSHAKEISFGGGLGICEMKCLRDKRDFMCISWRNHR